MKKVLISTALIALLLVVACGDDGPPPPFTPTPVGGNVTKIIRDGEYPDLNVLVGAKVIWRNEGEMAHTITFEDESMGDSGVIEEGQRSGPLTFNRPGTFKYFCRLHPGERATVTVSKE